MVRSALLDLARSYGFELVIPPMLEHLESLLSGTGHALDLKTFKLVDQLSGRMLGEPGWRHLDLSPPTDERPFFFNQLRLTDPQAIRRAMNAGAGVNVGNLRATLTLLMIIMLSLLLVLLTIIIPALPSMRQGSPRLVGIGTAYSC